MQQTSTRSGLIQDELEDFLRSKLSEVNSDVTDADIGVDLTALISSRVSDSDPRYSLEDIRHCVATLGLASELDALSMISLLIDSSLPGAQDLLDLVGECGNSKEVTISVQEVLERLRIRFSNDDEDEEEPTRPDERKCSTIAQFIRSLDLYSQAIPRLKLRKKSAAETLASLFNDLALLFDVSAPEMEVNEAEEVLISLSRLVQTSKAWSESQTADAQSEISAFLLKLLCDAIVPLSQHFRLNLAQDKFNSVFPRLRRNVGGPSTGHTNIVGACNASLKSLSCTWEGVVQDSRPGTLQLVAYCWPLFESSESSTERVLSRTLHLLLDSLVNGRTAIDESLFIILSALYPNDVPGSQTTQEWDTATVLPLINALSMLACGHPDGQVRLIAFRAIGGLLFHLPPILHIRVLHDLLTDAGLPHMRTAAVGLLKDAVIAALASSSSSLNPFASPVMLQTFGNVVLRPDPPDLFSRPISLEEFDEMDEGKRLVECLSFYYVLILRDVDNRTGVRDSDQIRTVEGNLLKPLQAQLDRWAEGGATMSLAGLTMALERASSAIEDVRS